MIPIRPSELNYADKWPKYIVIHHTEELDIKDGAVKYDLPKVQIQRLQQNVYRKYQKTQLPYHFVVDKLENNDYTIHIGKPLLTISDEFLDLDDEYLEGIHIALIGDYNNDIPDDRLYHILAFKLIIPLMKMLRINENNVVRHSDVSLDPENTCPGSIFNLAKLKSFIKNKMRKKSISRR